MKKFCLLFIAAISLIIFTNCKKECTDDSAVNFEREGECLYCKSIVETETITVPVTDLITYSPLYGQVIAVVTLERKFTAFVGKGCGLDYEWKQTPACEINMKVKNISNKKFRYYRFLVEYALNDTYGSGAIYRQDTLYPNQETPFTNFSNIICGNLKNAKVTVTAKDLVVY